ncbi:MAG: hypothetical protein KBC36_12020 [Spirochaetia bacterium]|nr:hypothetical protein [Spirochaetia bacterium]
MLESRSVFGRIAAVVALSIAVFSASSCDPNVFVETVAWGDEGDGFLTYRTNDPEELDRSAWRLDGYVQAEVGYTVEAKVRKVSGSPTTGYGIVFCAQDDDNFYRVLVNVNGRFNVYKRVAGTWSQISGWEDSPALNEGYGVDNTIKVARDGDVLRLYFNGTSVGIFNPAEFKGGQAGFYAGIGSRDSETFPQIFSETKFTQTLPVPIP